MNIFNIPISRSVVISFVIAGIVAVWLLSGQLGGGQELQAQDASAAGTAEPVDGSSTEGAAPSEENLPFVRVRTITAQSRETDLVIRGRTEALRRVEVKAETSGTILTLPVEKGSVVAEGDVICELKIDAREAEVAEALAVTEQRKLEYDGIKKLRKKGVKSEVQEAASKAAYEAALARHESAKLELEHTKIAAPFDGIVNERPVEVGDFVRPGDTCALVVDVDPMLVIGQVSERDISKLSVGARGEAKLITGEELDGRIRYISRSADQATRTFRVELEVSNEEAGIPDGITADITVPTRSVAAHMISPAVLTLDDKGVIGVRIVDKANVVSFVPVAIISDSAEGVWVTGLPRTVTLITVGQEFVSAGQKVQTADDGEGS